MHQRVLSLLNQNNYYIQPPIIDDTHEYSDPKTQSCYHDSSNIAQSNVRDAHHRHKDIIIELPLSLT